MPDSNAGVDLVRSERRALSVAAVAAVAMILWLMRPIGMGMLIGALMAFSFQPIYEALARRFRPSLAALATVIGSTLAIALTFGGLVWLLVRDATIFGRQVVESLGAGGGARRVLYSIAELTNRVGISAEDLEAKVRGLVDSVVAHAAGAAEAIASTTASALLATLFVMLTMYFILRRWEAVSTTAQATLPMRPEYTRKLFDEFRSVGRTTLLSTVLIGFVQGTLATIGYFIVGLPRPFFFGAMTAVASSIPGVGTMLVWVPAGIVLILLGDIGRGIVDLAWGIIVVTGIPDYVIRPRLVGHGSSLPALLTFTALFGGVEVFGLKGFILGPVLMAVAIAVLRLYAAEASEARGHSMRPSLARPTATGDERKDGAEVEVGHRSG